MTCPNTRKTPSDGCACDEFEIPKMVGSILTKNTLKIYTRNNSVILKRFTVIRE